MRGYWLVFTGFLLVGCAAQDSHRQYFSAQRQLEVAEANNPKSPEIAKARERLEAGRLALKQGRYDVASREFKESNRISEPIADPEGYKKKLAAKGVLIPPPPIPVAQTPAPQPTPAMPATPAPQTPLVAQTPPVETMKPRSLPAQALAKYLASKKGTTIEEAKKPAAVVAKSSRPAVTPKDAKRTKLGAMTPMKKAIPQKGPDPNEEEAPAQKILDDEDDARVLSAEESKQPKLEAEKVTVTKEATGLVAASAKPTDKFTDHEKPKAPAPSLVPQAEKPKTKIPGSLKFSSNESTLEPDSMLNLDQTSKFLLENPSTSVVFQGVLGPGESNAMVDSRFESLRSYLVGKGVPDDQVRLDQKRRSGARPEFEMYIVEH